MQDDPRLKIRQRLQDQMRRDNIQATPQQLEEAVEYYYKQEVGGGQQPAPGQRQRGMPSPNYERVMEAGKRTQAELDDYYASTKGVLPAMGRIAQNTAVGALDVPGEAMRFVAHMLGGEGGQKWAAESAQKTRNAMWTPEELGEQAARGGGGSGAETFLGQAGMVLPGLLGAGKVTKAPSTAKGVLRGMADVVGGDAAARAGRGVANAMGAERIANPMIRSGIQGASAAVATNPYRTLVEHDPWAVGLSVGAGGGIGALMGRNLGNVPATAAGQAAPPTAPAAPAAPPSARAAMDLGPEMAPPPSASPRQGPVDPFWGNWDPKDPYGVAQWKRHNWQNREYGEPQSYQDFWSSKYEGTPWAKGDEGPPAVEVPAVQPSRGEYNQPSPRQAAAQQPSAPPTRTPGQGAPRTLTPNDARNRIDGTVNNPVSPEKTAGAPTTGAPFTPPPRAKWTGVKTAADATATPAADAPVSAPATPKQTFDKPILDPEVAKMGKGLKRNDVLRTGPRTAEGHLDWDNLSPEQQAAVDYRFVGKSLDEINRRFKPAVVDNFLQQYIFRDPATLPVPQARQAQMPKKGTKGAKATPAEPVVAAAAADEIVTPAQEAAAPPPAPPENIVAAFKAGAGEQPNVTVSPKAEVDALNEQVKATMPDAETVAPAPAPKGKADFSEFADELLDKGNVSPKRWEEMKSTRKAQLIRRILGTEGMNDPKILAAAESMARKPFAELPAMTRTKISEAFSGGDASGGAAPVAAGFPSAAGRAEPSGSEAVEPSKRRTKGKRRPKDT
jgi:hypothetical protein